MRCASVVALVLLALASVACSKEETAKPEAAQPAALGGKALNPAQPGAKAPAAAAPGAGAVAPMFTDGTSAPPTVAEWESAPSVNTVGPNSAPKDCYMKAVREWLKVNCSGSVTRVTNMDGFGKQNVDYFEAVTVGKSADFVVRVKKGGSLKLRILRSSPHSASLFVNWPGSLPKPSIVALQIFNG